MVAARPLYLARSLAGAIGGSMMLASLARGGATVAIVGGLIFSPFGAQAAEADANNDIAITTSALGGVLLTAPATLGEAAAAEGAATAAAAAGTACIATVICGGVMVAIGVGALAYTTRDTWVPWVKSWAAGGMGNSSGGASAVVTIAFIGQPTRTGLKVSSFLAANAGQSPGNFQGTYHCLKAGVVSGTPPGSPGVALSGQYDWQPGTFGGTESQPVALPLCTSSSVLRDLVINVVSSYTPFSVESNTLSFNPVNDVPSTVTTTNKVCQRPDGSRYTDARSVSGDTAAIPVGFCLPGDTAVSVGVVVTPPSGSPIVTQALPLTPTTTDLANYPLCAGAACEYQIVLDGVPCRVGVAGCSEWAAISQATPGRVSARYGPYAVPVSSVPWLKHLYDSSTPTKVTTTTATGGDPNDPKPKPIAGVAPPLLTDPTPIPRGTPLPKPGPNPSAGDCWPTGAARWSPVDWVLAPVECALSWAFVPDTATVTALADGVKADIARTGVPALATAVAVPLTSIPDGGNTCSGPRIVLPLSGYEFPVEPLNACAEPMKSAAVMTNAFSTIVIVVGGGLSMLRLVAAGFGFNVALRGGGGDSA